MNDIRFGTFSGRGEDADDCIFRFNLEDLGPSKPNGFQRAEGGPPNMKAEEMMRDLLTHFGGLKQAIP